MQPQPEESPVMLLTGVRHPSEARLADRLRYEQACAVRERLTDQPSAARLLNFIAEASDFAEAMVTKHRDPASPPIACKEGCGWCCHQPVRITALEAFRVARFIKEDLAPDARQRIVDRLHVLDETTRGMPLDVRLASRKTCAFLEDGRCSIYAARPLACAGFTSYDVEACKRHRESGFKSNDVIQEKARMLVYYAVQRGLADGLQQALPEADTAPLELTAAVVNVLARANAEQAWTAGEAVFVHAHIDERKG